MKKRMDDKGFFLLETLLLCLILMALSGVFTAYRCSERMHEDNKAHIAAVFLAGEQMAYVMEKGSEGKLRPGDLEWLGAEDALSMNRKRYEARTEISVLEEDTAFFRIRVTILWEQSGKRRQVHFERLVRNTAAGDEVRE